MTMRFEEEDEDSLPWSDTTGCCSFPCFASNSPPYLAIVTESNACDSDENLHKTLSTLKHAVSTDDVDLVSVRVSPPLAGPSSSSSADDQNDAAPSASSEASRRVRHLIQQLVEWSYNNNNNKTSSFVVVVSSAWMDDSAAISLAHGFHFKESHRERISKLLDGYEHENNNHLMTGRRQQQQQQPYVIGTSCHSVESALEACYDFQKMIQHPPDYLFVGTCYPTASHPEKLILEGPALPGQVREALEQEEEEKLQQHQNDTMQTPPLERRKRQRPRVLAIGGIDASNCQEPIRLGAEGVAVIRAVFESSNPAQTVRTIKQQMRQAMRLSQPTRQD